jgi:hypothetical protein
LQYFGIGSNPYLFSVAQVDIAKPGEAFSKNEAIAKSAYDDKFVMFKTCNGPQLIGKHF